jgi:hypothetical protein
VQNHPFDPHFLKRGNPDFEMLANSPLIKDVRGTGQFDFPMKRLIGHAQ